MKRHQRRRHFLTLLELVISLAIVALLAAVVLDSFSEHEMEQRADTSAQRGRLVKEAILGNRESDGLSRFLSDMGRWPCVHIESGDGSGKRYLAQLYDRSIFRHTDTQSMFNHSAEFTLTQSIVNLPENILSYPLIAMNVGWSGPYLHLLGADAAGFYDGWGNPWKIIANYYEKAQGNKLVAVNDTAISNPDADTIIDGIISFGADGMEDEGGENYVDKDQKFIFAHETNLARLVVTIKVRDDFNPAIWKTVNSSDDEIAAIEAYIPGGTYERGVMVYADAGATRHYYSCTSSDVTTQPYVAAGNWTATNPGWRYGLPKYMADQIRFILFSPIKRGNKDTSSGYMDIGCFLFESGVEGAVELLDSTGAADRDTEDRIESSEFDGRRMIALATWNGNAELVVERLVPGRRKVWGCAFRHNGANYLNFSTSIPEWIDLRPGNNYLTVYLETMTM